MTEYTENIDERQAALISWSPNGSLPRRAARFGGQPSQEGWLANRSSGSITSERRLVPEEGVEPSRGVNPTGFRGVERRFTYGTNGYGKGPRLDRTTLANSAQPGRDPPQTRYTRRPLDRDG